ncbi:MAG: AAA family ATPase, partial [Clostridiales bacterium]|nr:AAA family ATPase [Clostridiales bacterium]
MIIEKIEIGSFGKLDNMTLELSGGVNIIRGANESGKSTICNFIVFIFYGLPKDRDVRAKYISWNTGTARGAITFRNDDGTRYRIERDAICQSTPDGKSSTRERAAVYNADTGAMVSKNEMPGGIFFGVPENVFNSTVYIRQLDGTKIGDASLSEAAENILFSGDEGLNTKKAVEKLDEARVYLRYKNKKGGKLFELEEKRDELSQKLAEAKDAGNEIIYLEGSARQLDEARADADSRAEKLKDELELYEAYTIKKSYTKYKETMRKVKELENEAQKVRLSEDFNGVDVYSDEYIQNLEKKRSSLEIAKARLDESQNRFDAARKHVYDMKEKIEVFEKFGTKHGERANTI